MPPFTGIVYDGGQGVVEGALRDGGGDGGREQESIHGDVAAQFRVEKRGDDRGNAIAREILAQSPKE